MKKILGLSLLITIVGCSNTPNNVAITVNQGPCVQSSMYSSSVTPPSNIANNPTSAPYCSSVTLQNNNSGTNATNIQITSSGLTASYSVGSNSYNATLYDPVAAGFTISGQTQILGNLMVYDPKNCITTQGANVITLNSGGYSCTFYLQLTGESNPVGVYPITLTYNYTNGNQNFSLSSIVNQRVYLYGGTNQGLFFNLASLSGASSSPTWQTGLTGAPTSSVANLISDAYGNVYIAAANNVYVYNGITTTQVGNSFNSGVNALAFDANGYLYAATSSNGIYMYNESPAAWVPFINTNNNGLTATSSVIGLKGVEYSNESPAYLYAITESKAYYCTSPNESQASCAWNSINTGSNAPTSFTFNALDIDPSDNLYVGSESYGYMATTSGSWAATQYLFEPNGAGSQISGFISGVRYNPFTPSTPLYFSEALQAGGSALIESSVYSCNESTVTPCTPVISSESGAMMGNAYVITTDGMGNLYVAGNSLNSSDYESTVTNTYGSYILFNTTVNGGASSWQPITNGNISGNYVQSLLVSSMLTSY